MEKIKDIIINTPERFIGKYRGFRISIVKVNGYTFPDIFDIDICGADGFYVLETIEKLNEIKFAIKFAIKWIDENKK